MSVKRIVVISFLVVFLFSCNNQFPDYIEKEDGIYMKLLSFEEDEKGFENAAYTIASIEVEGAEGLLYKRYKEDAIQLKNNEFSFLMQHLKEGDSASFKVLTDKIIKEFYPIKFNNTTSEYVDVTIKIHRYFTQSEYLTERQGYDKEMMEQLILTKYLKEFNNIKNKNGIFIEPLRKGKGKKVNKGDVITIAYKGYFINRLEFDKIAGATAFTFTYGTPGQVIKGLDIAIKGMKEGEKSKIIIPSQLAFGEEGSTTRVVPPFTTVIYELEIVNVK